MGTDTVKKYANGASGIRRLIIVDIENFKGKAVLTEADAIDARIDIESNYEYGPFDLVLIGTSHQNNFVNAKLAWPEAQHCFKPGHNGADIALIDAAEALLRKPASFKEVILLSGDGIFTRLIWKVKQLGIKSTVVSLANQINANLAYAAHSCNLITPAVQVL